VGGGLAGCEAAWQLARRGIGVDLVEMRPGKATPVHQTADLAELVCSNSLRGNALDQAAGLLKEEMRRLDSLIVRVADEVKVPAGSALAVDRTLFSRRITELVCALPEVSLHRREVAAIPEAPVAIVATGPLTSEPLAESLREFVGQNHLYFYDAVSPVIEADSIDFTKAFRASRYGKGGDDYLNCPLTEEEYRAFHEALRGAESASVHEFEKEKFFEGCLPVEVIGSRGPETLRFGPMKPVGLQDPRAARRPFAVVQLRQDNLAASHYSMVGFQTQLKWSEQKRVFRMIPGLENAEFVRFGMIHRNTYVNAPSSLEPTFETRRRPGLIFAGQMSGVEGYVESAASGLAAALGAAFRVRGEVPLAFPEDTAMGALGRYIARSDPRNYQPTNIAFGLLPELPARIKD
jgi:methylenetetrahydrofolate--tRNA-(uracil-5-)-methyltransferase